MDPWRRKSDFNKDLAAVGFGNIVSGALGGQPMISEVARSSANVSNYTLSLHDALPSIGRASCRERVYGFECCIGPAVDHDDFVTAFQQVPRCADADDAGAENNGFHMRNAL